MTVGTTNRCARPIDPPSFQAWLDRAEAGAGIEYHRGHLLWDRSPGSGLDGEERRALRRVADTARRAANDGRVHLVQRRNGEFDFSYLAIKAGRTGVALRAA